MLWIPAEATDREETRVGAQKSLLKTKQKGTLAHDCLLTASGKN
jgi:hypothetical protein